METFSLNSPRLNQSMDKKRQQMGFSLIFDSATVHKIARSANFLCDSTVFKVLFNVFKLLLRVSEANEVPISSYGSPHRHSENIKTFKKNRKKCK